MKRVLASLILALVLCPMGAAAQEIRGTVSDSTGGVLPGVTVTVTNSETKVAQTAVTDDKGLFEVLYLNPGTYTVSAELSGFKTVVLAGNEVRVGDVLRLGLVLQTGGVTE